MAILHLTPSGKRARAAAMIRTVTDVPSISAQFSADALDLISAGALQALGIEGDEARAVLAALWTDQ